MKRPRVVLVSIVIAVVAGLLLSPLWLPPLWMVRCFGRQMSFLESIVSKRSLEGMTTAEVTSWLGPAEDALSSPGGTWMTFCQSEWIQLGPDHRGLVVQFGPDGRVLSARIGKTAGPRYWK